MVIIIEYYVICNINGEPINMLGRNEFDSEAEAICFLIKEGVTEEFTIKRIFSLKNDY